MDKNSLYRFFEGQASIEEMKAVKEWAESSEEHSKQFHRERKLFNAMILIGNPKWDSNKYNKKKQIFHQGILKDCFCDNHCGKYYSYYLFNNE